MKSKQLAYSFNGENYQGGYDTIEDIMKDLIEYPNFQDGDILYIGEEHPYSDCGSNAYDAIIDHFREEAYDVGGEYAESYLETINPEHQKFLEDKLDLIWEEFKKLTNEDEPFFTIPNGVKYKIYRDGRYELEEESINAN